MKNTELTRFFFLANILFLFSCEVQQNEPIQLSRSQQVEMKAKEYFDTFAERTDWEKLCSFYREDLLFQDIALQLNLDSLWKFKRFYNWDGEGDSFKKLSPEQKHLNLETLAVNDSVAVARGRINPFYYNGNLVDVTWGMEFTIWLYFDQDLKIKRQIDWMEYDPFVLESVVKRCRENGHEALPAWLDLTKSE